MNYLKPETLEFLIYLRYKNKPVDFNQFNPEKIKTVINDIIENKIEKFFTFDLNKQDYNPNLNADLMFLKQKIESKLRFGDSKRDYHRIKEIFDKINDPPKTINFQEFKEIQNEIYRYIYKLFSLNFYEPERDNLLKFLKEYIELFSNGHLPVGPFYNFKKNKEKIFELLQSYLKDRATEENPIFVIEPYYSLKEPFEQEFRFYDLIFYLISDDAIAINDCDFVQFDDDKKLRINITLKEPFIKIVLEENAWYIYKDLKVNKKTLEAINKSKSYTFETRGKIFKVLSYLIKNQKMGEISIYSLYKDIAPNETKNLKSAYEIQQFEEEIRDKFKYYIKYINTRLGSTGIHITHKDYIILK